MNCPFRKLGALALELLSSRWGCHFIRKEPGYVGGAHQCACGEGSDGLPRFKNWTAFGKLFRLLPAAPQTRRPNTLGTSKLLQSPSAISQ
jgi:hypothetical protein